MCPIVLLRHTEDEKLGGEGRIVEIDESKFGQRKYQRGCAVNGQWVFGGIERDSKRCFLQVHATILCVHYYFSDCYLELILGS